jgi:hypothetical protein
MDPGPGEVYVTNTKNLGTYNRHLEYFSRRNAEEIVRDFSHADKNFENCFVNFTVKKFSNFLGKKYSDPGTLLDLERYQFRDGL